METFQVVSMQRINSVQTGDTFIIEDGTRTVKSISHKYVYMDDNSFYPKKLFSKWCRIESNLKSKRLVVIKQARKTAAFNKSEATVKQVGYKKPSNLLRYIIIAYNNTYSWYFAARYCSHTDLENEYFELNPNERGKGYVAGGGFYAAVRANAKTDLNLYWLNGQQGDFDDTVLLFGKSDSYGIRKEVLVEALKFAPKEYNFIVIDNVVSLKTINL